MTFPRSTDEPAAPSREGGLRRLRLDLAYDGSEFSGWARQPGRRTVQGVVEDAMAMVCRLDQPPSMVVAGRTDAGVHASAQVAHVDLPHDVDPEQLLRRLAGVLPDDIAVRRVSIAPGGFDARFSATGRSYRYRVTDAGPNPLRRHDTVAWRHRLDQDAMNEAAQRLVGEHDFAAYCKPRAGATTIRVLRRLNVHRDDDLVVVAAQADAFCHNQVRAMVGALLAVGDGRRPVHWPGQVLLAGVRDSAVTVAPPHGLTLVGVDYPPDEQLADRAATSRAKRTETG